MTTLKHSDDTPITLPRWLVYTLLSIVMAAVGGAGRDFISEDPSSGPATAKVYEVRQEYLVSTLGELKRSDKEQTELLNRMADRLARIEERLR